MSSGPACSVKAAAAREAAKRAGGRATEIIVLPVFWAEAVRLCPVDDPKSSVISPCLRGTGLGSSALSGEAGCYSLSCGAISRAILLIIERCKSTL